MLTQSAETLRPHTVSLELREDFTEFEHLSQTQIEAKARAGGIDLLDCSFLSTASLNYGVADHFQVGLTLSYYASVNAREAEFDSGTGDTGMARSGWSHRFVAHG